MSTSYSPPPEEKGGGRRRRAALIILYDSEGRLLLQHRTEDAGLMPGYWAFFGGGIKEGESPEDAVRREALEELECDLREPRFITELDFEVGDVKGHLHVFIEPYHGDKSALRLREGQGWGWFSAPEIGELKMAPHDREIALMAAELAGSDRAI